MPVLAAAALLALAYGLVPSRGWGCLALASAVIALVVALRIECAEVAVPGFTWLAERKGMAWLMLPFAAFGAWNVGLAVLFAYAAGSFFWAQRQAHSGLPRRKD